MIRPLRPHWQNCDRPHKVERFQVAFAYLLAEALNLLLRQGFASIELLDPFIDLSNRNVRLVAHVCGVSARPLQSANQTRFIEFKETKIE